MANTAYESKNKDVLSFQHNVLSGLWISFIQASGELSKHPAAIIENNQKIR